MLCGISSRFQLLSPTERQVSHALLTRSPLNLSSIGRSRFPISPVRLACVRHAASVRPEPGSNSQKMVSQVISDLKSCFKKICLANFTQEFSLAVISILHRLNNPFIVQGVLVCLTLFNLQGTDARRSELINDSISFFVCQELFVLF